MNARNAYFPGTAKRACKTPGAYHSSHGPVSAVLVTEIDSATYQDMSVP